MSQAKKKKKGDFYQSPLPDVPTLEVYRHIKKLEEARETLDRIEQLIQEGYIKVDYGQLSLPLYERPIILVWQFTLMLKGKKGSRENEDNYLEVIAQCRSWGIPLYQIAGARGPGRPSPAITLKGMNTYLNSLYGKKNKPRFDRLALLQFFIRGIRMGQKEEGKHDRPWDGGGLTKDWDPGRLLPYDEMAERELRRIKRLPEPDRTFRAVAFLEAWDDAKTIGKAWKKYRRLVWEDAEVEVKVEKMREFVKKGKWPQVPG